MGTEHGRWGAEKFNGYDVKKTIDWDPAPFEPGCYVPDDLVISMLREALTFKFHCERLADLEPERFEQFPSDAYGPGQLDMILGMRAERAEKAETERKAREEWLRHEQYLAGLDCELRWAYEEKLEESLRKGEYLSRDELIEQAKACVARRRSQAGLPSLEAAE